MENRTEEERAADLAFTATNMAEKSVIELFKKYLVWKSSDKGAAEALCEEISILKTNNTSGCVKIDFEDEPLILIVMLCIGPKNFKPVVEVPDKETLEETLRVYAALKQFAMTYFEQFKSLYADVYNRALALVELDDIKLEFDENKAIPALAFDQEHDQRIIVLSYYNDRKGKIYIHPDNDMAKVTM